MLHKYLLLTVFAAACAENHLNTYLVVQNRPEQGADAEIRKGEIQLGGPPLLLTVTAPSADDLEELADDLKLASPTKYHRLPPLTYLRFDFENRTALPWKVSLASCYFSSGARRFEVVTAAEYAKRFTSVAYEHFQYEAMYSSYITQRSGIRPRDRFYFTKTPAHEPVEIGAHEKGFQILPFDFIPAGVAQLVLHYHTEGKAERTLNIRLVTERGK